MYGQQIVKFFYSIYLEAVMIGSFHACLGIWAWLWPFIILLYVLCYILYAVGILTVYASNVDHLYKIHFFSV